MAESDIFIVPQDQTINERLVVVTDSQRDGSGYKFDAVTRYRTQRSYKPTRHSVPSGSKITDHVTAEPIVFQLVGVLTPYNVVTIANVRSIFSGPIDSIEDALVDGANSALELVRRNRDQLIQFADEFTLLTVMGNEFQHPNMLITRIGDPKTPAMGDSYELTVSFSQIRVARQSSRIAPLISGDADALGGGPVKAVGQ